MKLSVIADLHGYYPDLHTGGCLLIVAGDSTAQDSAENWQDFVAYLRQLPYKEVWVLPGNHDMRLQEDRPAIATLCEGTNVHLLEPFSFRAYGSCTFCLNAWTPRFYGQRDEVAAFTYYNITPPWADIPLQKAQVLISHGPPRGILDKANGVSCGDANVNKLVFATGATRCFYGHIHEEHHISVCKAGVIHSNVSASDARYRLTTYPGMHVEL